MIRSILVALLVATPAVAQDCLPDRPEYRSSTGCLFEIGRFPQLLLGPSPTIASLNDQFPKPTSIRQGTPPDHEEPEDEVEFIDFQHPKIQILLTRSAGSQSGFIVSQMTLRAPDLSLPCGLSVSQPFADFKAKLGSPLADHYPTGQAYPWDRYWCEGDTIFAEHAMIEIHLSKDQSVEEIRWSYSAD